MSLHCVHIYQGVVLMCAPTGRCRWGAEGQGITPDPTALALPASRAYKVKVGIAGVIHGGSQPEVVPRPRPIQRHPWVPTGQGHDACEASSKRSTPPPRKLERGRGEGMRHAEKTYCCKMAGFHSRWMCSGKSLRHLRPA